MAKPQQNPADLAKQAGKLGELKARLLFLIGALIVYRVGTFIPVPGVDPAALATCLVLPWRTSPAAAPT